VWQDNVEGKKTIVAYTTAEAWAQKAKLSTDPNADTNDCLQCRLECNQCYSIGKLLVFVGNPSYVHRLTYTQDWYSLGFIYGFLALVEHDAHMSTPPFPTAAKVMMVYNAYPNAPITLILGYGEATHFVSIVLNSSHFAVLYYDIAGRTVSVLWSQHDHHKVGGPYCPHNQDVWVTVRLGMS
jgi:hypothetical protein